MLSERLVRFFFAHGFTTGEPDANNMFEISGYSRAGYHIVEVVDGTSASTIESSLWKIYESFSMEDYILSRLEVRKAHPEAGVPSISILINDAAYIDDMLEDTYRDFVKLVNGDK